jgi:hypothetical protein
MGYLGNKVRTESIIREFPSRYANCSMSWKFYGTTGAR